MPKIFGVVTARGGSKGIPGKNIKLLLGKPLIAYTIEAAKASGVFDKLILSTDDPEIAAVAKQYGCEAPFLRPRTEELSGDTATHFEVIRHAVDWLKKNAGYDPDYVMILQPTSPLRQAFHIKEAVERIQETGVDSVLSVAEIPENFNSRKAMLVNEAGYLRLLNSDSIYQRVARRQDLPKQYWSTGSIYLFKTALLFSAQPNFYGEKTLPIFIDSQYVCDINIPEDWEKAEQALKQLATSD